MICFGWAISIRRPTTACTFSGVTSQGGSVVAIIIALSLASGLRQASHFRSTPARAAMPPPPGIAQWDPDQQAAEVSTGDAQKLARLVSRELFVKPAKEKSLPGLRVESPARAFGINSRGYRVGS